MVSLTFGLGYSFICLEVIALHLAFIIISSCISFQQLELLMKAQGLNTGFCEDMAALSAVVPPNTVTNAIQHVQQSVKLETEQTSCVQALQDDIHTTLNLDDLMDDTSGLSADPMLSSHPVSPNIDEDSMDYMAMWYDQILHWCQISHGVNMKQLLGYKVPDSCLCLWLRVCMTRDRWMTLRRDQGLAIEWQLGQASVKVTEVLNCAGTKT